ncbi:MAG TPA: hypothetical protein VF773_15985 [Verrucomicrobiae bacterium]
MSADVLMFEAEEVLEILREYGPLSEGLLLDAVANYTRIKHPNADADSIRFHRTGLVVCDLKTKKPSTR